MDPLETEGGKGRDVEGEHERRWSERKPGWQRSGSSGGEEKEESVSAVREEEEGRKEGRKEERETNDVSLMVLSVVQGHDLCREGKSEREPLARGSSRDE